jgi:PBP1b-binding outer membrane lipoprotein LpoB
MDGKIGTMHKRKYMMALQNSSILLALCLLLTGCATTDNYPIYVEAQKSLSRDATVAEAARIAALTEMVKSSDNEVKIQAIKALQEIQSSKRQIIIQRPKGWLGN